MGIVVGGPCVLLAALKSPDKLLLIRRREGVTEWLLPALVDRSCSLLLMIDRFDPIGRKIGTRSAISSLSTACVPSGCEASICSLNVCCGVAVRLAALLECPGPGDPIS